VTRDPIRPQPAEVRETAPIEVLRRDRAAYGISRRVSHVCTLTDSGNRAILGFYSVSVWQKSGAERALNSPKVPSAVPGVRWRGWLLKPVAAGLGGILMVEATGGRSRSPCARVYQSVGHPG